MMMSKRVQHEQRRAGGGISTRLRLMIAALCLGLFAASPAVCQTVTYSDSWFVDNSGVTYDAEHDLDLYPEAQSEPSLVAGAGVSEASYDSYLESVETTLTSPDGRSVSGSAYDNPYARVELTLAPIASETEEYQYDVRTTHTYWRDEQDTCGQPRACMASYRPTAPVIWGFYRVYTYSWVRIRPANSNYTYSGTNYFLWTPPVKVCVMSKLCGTCGRGSTGYVTASWAECPRSMGIIFSRVITPFGSYCAGGYGYNNRVLFCS